MLKVSREGVPLVFWEQQLQSSGSNSMSGYFKNYCVLCVRPTALEEIWGHFFTVFSVLPLWKDQNSGDQTQVMNTFMGNALTV